MAKKWRCTVCGYIHESPEAPDQCPMCKVGKEKFVEVEEKAGGLDFVTEHKLGDGKGASQELWEGLNNHFMGECSEVGQYLAMARQADREGYPEIAEAFKRYAWEAVPKTQLSAVKDLLKERGYDLNGYKAE